MGIKDMKRVLTMRKKKKTERSNPCKNNNERILSSAFLQSFIDSIPIPIFYQDNRGVYLGGNQQFGDFLGRKVKDIIGKTIHEIVSRDLAEMYARADRELLQTGEDQAYECAVLHADGTKRIVFFSKTKLKNRDGISAGLIGSIFDITGQKELEEKLRRDEKRYRRIFENIQDVYYEIELDGTILEISPSINKYSKFQREDLIGRSIYDFYADKNRREILLQAIKEKGSIHDFEIQLLNYQGSSYTCSITAEIMPGDKDRPPWIVGSLRDISERKQNEENLKQREEELSIKTRNLEEVNTALKVLLKQREEDRKEIEENVLTNLNASILPYIEKLKYCRLNGQQMAYLKIIEARMKEIISPFLHRISQGCFDLTPQEIRVADFVKFGNTTKEIADILGVSIKTIDYHRDNIRKKLGIKNRQTNLRSFLLQLS
jgi:PAS domain S-box-containing protein